MKIRMARGREGRKVKGRAMKKLCDVNLKYKKTEKTF